MIGSIPVKIHNYPKEEADDEDASAGGDFGSSDSENSVSKIDEFAKATEYRSVPVDHDDRMRSLLDVPHSFQNISASGLTFSWELTRVLVGSDAKEQLLDVPRFKTIESHKKHGKFFIKLTLNGKCRLDEHIDLLLKLNYAIQADKLRIAKPSIQVSLNLFNFLHSNDINLVA